MQNSSKQFFKQNIFRFLLITLIVFLFFGCNEEKTKSAKESVITTFYLIRHAEKDRTDPSNSNPELNQSGLGRAIKWAEIFEPIDLNVIYSTDYERTTMTAAPTSVNKDISITYYNPSTIDIDSLKSENLNKNVLIVGHSNTTSALVNKLIGNEKYETMDDTDNGSLFIVRIIDGVATDIRLNINLVRE